VREKFELCKNCENKIGNFVKTYGIKLRTIFRTNSKLYWKHVEECWWSEAINGNGEGEEFKMLRNHCQCRHWNYAKEKWKKKIQDRKESLYHKLRGFENILKSWKQNLV
jgi:hypothetical protein